MMEKKIIRNEILEQLTQQTPLHFLYKKFRHY